MAESLEKPGVCHQTYSDLVRQGDYALHSRSETWARSSSAELVPSETPIVLIVWAGGYNSIVLSLDRDERSILQAEVAEMLVRQAWW